MVFQPSHLSKQSRPSHHNTAFFFPYFKEDRLLCPVETLKAYEERTVSFRSNNSGGNHLFRSFIGKHGPVTSSTIARWIKSCLQKAGVDTSKFQAHSTRAAATTKAAMSGLTVEDIIKAADWSSVGVFQKFYYRPQYPSEFGDSSIGGPVLQNHMLIWKPSLSKYNLQMAQVMQWPPAICNYMRKVRLKYQHVPPTLCPLVILYSQEKKLKC